MFTTFTFSFAFNKDAVRKTYNQLMKNREDFTGFATDVRLDYFFHTFIYSKESKLLQQKASLQVHLYHQGSLKQWVLQVTAVNGSVLGQMPPYQIVL